MNPTILTFFKEFFQRLFIKSPVFFRVFQVVTATLTFAGYFPSMLQRWFNVEVPGHVITMCEDVAKYATGFFAASALTAQTKPVAIMDDGDVLKKTDDKKLPFTKKCEDKSAKEELAKVQKVPEVVDIKEGEESFAPEKKEE